MEYTHQSVMLEECIQGLNIDPAGIYMDATFGRGGHSQAILDKLNDQGRLIALDQDPEAVETAKQRFQNEGRFCIHHETFARVSSVVTQESVMGQVHGILFDLGVSSPQLDDSSRGFSFLREGPLDMRMNTTEGASAAEWLAHVDEKTLIHVLKTYGEERFAKRITRKIIAAREEAPITTTKQLACLIEAAIPMREKHKHPATRTFQAIRLFVNQELEALKQALEQCMDILAVGGRLVVISFHSLEDRIVKQFMARYEKGEPIPKGLPITDEARGIRLKLIQKKGKASKEEVQHNPRARSAVLRIAEKIK